LNRQDFYRPTPLETAWGWVPGWQPADPSDAGRPAMTPRAALEGIVVDALQHSPCIVTFSGGRDSSAVLAVAVAVARREGLPLPVPLTQVFRSAPETEESSWQELVLRHLEVTDWIRHSFDDEMDVVGPVSAAGLRRHGVIWPPLAYSQQLAFDVARGGAMLSGEGGDEVLGPQRITPMTQLAARRAPLDRRAVKHLGFALAPWPLRRAAMQWQARSEQQLAWLRPAAAKEYRAAMADEVARYPLRWDHSIRALRRRRAVRTGLFRNFDLLARESAVHYVHPLLDATFLEALAAFGGPRGFASRTEAMRALFADLLPPAILARSSKAVFNASAINIHSRSFIASWTGAGVDPELVNPDLLLAEWQSPSVDSRTFMLLQQAWLAAHDPTGTAGAPAGARPEPRPE
jgi:hypothetical protein